MIVGPKGELIDQIYLTQTLTAGDNTIAFSEPGEKFANIDGPYRISGLVVVGAGHSAMLFQLAPTVAYSGARFVGARTASVTPVPVNDPRMLGLLAVLVALAGWGTWWLRDRRR